MVLYPVMLPINVGGEIKLFKANTLSQFITNQHCRKFLKVYIREKRFIFKNIGNDVL